MTGADAATTAHRAPYWRKRRAPSTTARSEDPETRAKARGCEWDGEWLQHLNSLAAALGDQRGMPERGILLLILNLSRRPAKGEAVTAR